MKELTEFLTFISESKEKYKEDSSEIEKFITNLPKDTKFEDIFGINENIKNVEDISIIPEKENINEIIEDIIIIPEKEEYSLSLDKIEPIVDIDNYSKLIEDTNKYLKDSNKIKEKDIILPNNIKILTERLNKLENYLQNINLAGSSSGGGAGEIYNLDIPTKLVTSDYTVGRKDYYIGVNANTKVNIILPITSKNGRILIIKDESGNANLTSIDIIGTIDNDTQGVSIRVNNFALQLIYRDGWRII